MKTDRWIAHVDMDCFFVAVERLKDPSLVGKPVIVGGDPGGRGVVSSASYEAREYGVHSAMPAAEAKKLCPRGIFLRGSFRDYDEYSLKVRSILEEYTPLVEMASIDEAYLDLTGTERLYGRPMQAAETIRNRIVRELGLVASFGIGPNKLIAKIASVYGKPNAITMILSGCEAAFLAPMDIRKLPGIGPRTAEKLRESDIQSIGDMANYQTEQLANVLGDRTRAEQLQARASGVSESPVVPERERKSISKEITFPEDIRDGQYLHSILHYLSGQVISKLRMSAKKAHTITIKYRYPDFETHTKAQTLENATDRNEEVYSTARRLFDESADVSQGIRLIGVGVSHLHDGSEQLGLFRVDEKGTPESEKRVRAIEELRDKYGYDAVVSGQSVNLLKSGDPKKKES
ncbi:MAG TPA: DNA polymerase IV [bacterium]|nr:DNA polymerase IV [bacterium]